MKFKIENQEERPAVEAVVIPGKTEWNAGLTSGEFCTQLQVSETLFFLC